MKNRKISEKLGDFVLGKGFYIVLVLCVATIGISGYYLIRSMNDGQTAGLEPAGGNSSVVLPDSEANGPEPVGTLTPDLTEDRPTAGQAQVELPQPTDDPEPVKEPVQQPEGSSQTALPQQTAVVYTWPVKGELLRDFSVETLSPDPTLGDWRTHGGLDIAASLGTNVLAMCPGTVAQVYDDGLMGTTVVIDHGDGLISACCGLAAQPTVQEGDLVETGTIIGTVGNTAIAESGLVSHLHLEVSLNGELVDPTEYLPER